MKYRLSDIYWVYNEDGSYIIPVIRNNQNTKIKNLLNDEIFELNGKTSKLDIQNILSCNGVKLQNAQQTLMLLHHNFGFTEIRKIIRKNIFDDPFFDCMNSEDLFDTLTSFCNETIVDQSEVKTLCAKLEKALPKAIARENKRVAAEKTRNAEISNSKDF